MGQSVNHHIRADVLIIGGGFSGLWAAISAREHVDNVLLVDKGPVDWGGLGTASGGDFQCVQDCTVEEALNDVVYYYDGLCDQPLVKRILQESYERFQHYERLGVKFSRDADGKLMAIPQRNLSHMKMLLVRPYGTGGPSMRDALVREAERLGVRRLSRIAVTEILKNQEGSAAGAVGFHTQSGETFLFEAPTTILATGGGGWRPSYITMSNSTGEGAWLAYKAGAELSHNEFMNIWIQPVVFSWEGQTGLLPLGARLVNKDGEDFMSRYYSPRLGSNTDTTYNSRGMAFEARAGRSPFYFDTTPMSPENSKLMEPVHGWAKLNYDRLVKEHGMQFFNGKTRWMPQIMWHSGGPVTDLEYETTIPCLYAVCRCKGFDPGVYMGGWALCTTAVTGYIAGANAARKSKDSKRAPLAQTQVREAVQRTLAPLKKRGIDSKDLIRETQEIVYPADVCLIKSDASLKRAVKRLDYAHELEAAMAAKDPRDLCKYFEAQTMLMRAEFFVRSSLMRTESRAGHYREDYPMRNNDEWLSWIHVRKEREEPVFFKVRIPIENYPIQPYRYYMDNFTFPSADNQKV